MKFNRFALLGVTCMVGLGYLAGQSYRGEVPHLVPPVGQAPLPKIDINAPGRTALQLTDWAKRQAVYVDISVHALEAYGYAAEVMAETRPDCGITWNTIAAIGSIESQHGTYPPGRTIHENGDVTPPIRSLKALDHSYHLTDADGNVPEEAPRAMGPFQFIPETWRDYAVDANGDGKLDPDNIDDAALTAARYMCMRAEDMTTSDGWRTGIASYNSDDVYFVWARDRANRYSVGLPAG